MNISVVGLGKLGSVLAAVLAERGHQVTGVDVDPAIVAAINEHRPPVPEPGLDLLIGANSSRLSATQDLESATRRTSITFVVLPTPSAPNGSFSLDHILPAAEKIGRSLQMKSGYHLVVISSTVMPGSMANHVLPAIETASGLKCGIDFGLCYNPEFIALGSVIQDLSNPDMVLIGESDTRAGDMLEELYRGVCANRPPISRMSFVNAELAKIALNAFVTMKISYANTLAEICSATPGADAAAITRTIGLDRRIGAKYLQGALGYGGPCFPRDNAAFSWFARQRGVEAALAEATDLVNRRQIGLLGERILRLLPEGETAGILGLSYKPDTAVIDASQGIQLAEYLKRAGRKVIVYDPAAMENARRAMDPDIAFASSMEACAREASVLAIVTPWAEFKTLEPKHLRQPGPVVIDCWRILPRPEFEHTALYLTCGEGALDSLQERILEGVRG